MESTHINSNLKSFANYSVRIVILFFVWKPLYTQRPIVITNSVCVCFLLHYLVKINWH